MQIIWTHLSALCCSYDAFFYAKDIGGTSVEMTPEALARVLLIPLRPALKAFGACSSTNLAIQGGAPHGFADAELGEPKFSPWAQSLKRLFS